MCAFGNFVDALGNCAKCITGCDSCSNSNSCNRCAYGLLLEQGQCKNRCSQGFYVSGAVCEKCNEGCAFCTSINTCDVCQSGRLSYNGICYRDCPDGSVADNTTSKCVPCNSPCKTCTSHPSKCTTCDSCCGNLFNFDCVKTCPISTFSSRGKCEFCSYDCATCLGSSTTCTSCASNKILYNGACLDKCPSLLVNGVCLFNCQKGFYKIGLNQCVKCDSSCVSCENVSTNCTECPIGSYSSNGYCVRVCPIQTIPIDGVCQPCDVSCSGCLERCDQCVNCAQGYLKYGSKCFKNCPDTQYLDISILTCRPCYAKCKTCSSVNFCTTCVNPLSTPVNGLCYDCAYPCR